MGDAKAEGIIHNIEYSPRTKCLGNCPKTRKLKCHDWTSFEYIFCAATYALVFILVFIQ